MSSQPTVHVVDDDEKVRRALRRLIESSGLKVRTYASAMDFLDERDDMERGCVVLDIRMPGMDGLKLQDALNDKGIRIPIVFVTGHGNIPMGVRAIKAGAVDFIQKPFDDQDLLDAIQRALAKNEQTLLELALENEITQRLNFLTTREREVLPLIVTGVPISQIASQLGVSEKIVEEDQARVLKKLQVDSLPELVRLALATGIHKP